MDQYDRIRTHAWEAGMMYVDSEDLGSLPANRVIECGVCGHEDHASSVLEFVPRCTRKGHDNG
jgi:hypothetical protein